MREFDDRSRHFLSGDHFINSHNLSLDSVWILLGENWSWSLLGLKGLKQYWLCAHPFLFIGKRCDTKTHFTHFTDHGLGINKLWPPLLMSVIMTREKALWLSICLWFHISFISDFMPKSIWPWEQYYGVYIRERYGRSL